MRICMGRMKVFTTISAINIGQATPGAVIATAAGSAVDDAFSKRAMRDRTCGRTSPTRSFLCSERDIGASGESLASRGSAGSRPLPQRV